MEAVAPALTTSLLDRIRNATVGAHKTFVRQEVVLDEESGLVVEVRQPSVAERGRILKMSGAKAGEAVQLEDLGSFQANMVIMLTVVPGTSDPVFSRADMDSMLSQPAGGWFDRLFETASALMNVEAAAAGNGSRATPSAS